MKKIETLAEYQQLASRTCPDLGTPENNLYHMNWGIFTELGEFTDPLKKNLAYGKPLDVVNLSEELTDCAWYVSNKARLFFPKSWEQLEKEGTGLEYYSEQNATIFDSKFDEMSINQRVSLLVLCLTPDESDYELEFTKKNFSGMDEMALLFAIAKFYEIDLWQALTNNIEKLQIRYPEKFTQEAALNRDLEAEREVLEQ